MNNVISFGKRTACTDVSSFIDEESHSQPKLPYNCVLYFTETTSKQQPSAKSIERQDRDKNILPRFDGLSSLIQWRHRVANLLLGHDYGGVVGFDLDTLLPLNITPSLHEDKLKKMDREAKAAIQHRVNDAVFTITRHCETSYGTRKVLHHRYQRKACVLESQPSSNFPTRSSVKMKQRNSTCVGLRREAARF